MNRCPWSTTETYNQYHDEEWGKLVHDDRKLFEMLILEGMQAGLSWITILNKREAFRQAFDDFDYEKIALYDDVKKAQLMNDTNIVRNRLKINASITNANGYKQIITEYGSFHKYIWQFVGYSPIVGHYEVIDDVPIKTEISDTISKDLKKRGFKFVGSTTIYAYMQAVGLVNDHLINCDFRGV